MSRAVMVHPPLKKHVFGGGEHTLFSAAQALEEVGYSLSFIFSGRVNLEFFERNLEIRVPKATLHIFRGDALPRVLRLTHHLIHPLLTPDIDAEIYVNMSADSHPLAVPPRALLLGKPIVFYFLRPILDKIWVRSEGFRRGKGLKRFYHNSIISLVHRIFRKVHDRGLFIANSKYSAESIKRACGLSSEVLYSPVEVDRYLWKGEDKERMVVASGRLIPRKRFELAVKAVKRLDPDVRLIIFGILWDVAYYNKLLKLINDEGLLGRVKIVVGAPVDVRAKTLRKASAFVHCSIEGFGKVAVEAMAAGCVPVVLGIGGQAEFTPKEFHYLTFEEMVQRLREALDAPETLRWELVERSKGFSRDRYKERFIELLRDRGLIRDKIIIEAE